MFFDKFSNMTMLEKFRYIFVLFLFLAIVAIFRIAYLQYLDKDRIYILNTNETDETN